MPEKPTPSYHSSTLSQMAMASLMCYLIGASWIGLKTGDLAGLKWAAEIFAASYLASRSRNGDSKPKEPVNAPVVDKP